NIVWSFNSWFVWFYSRIETAAERPTHALNTGKNLHRAPPERLRRTFCLLTQTYHGCRITGKVPSAQFNFGGNVVKTGTGHHRDRVHCGRAFRSDSMPVPPERQMAQDECEYDRDLEKPKGSDRMLCIVGGGD